MSPTAHDEANNDKIQKQMDPDENWIETRSTKQVWLEWALLCLTMMAWNVEKDLMANFFNELQKTWGVSQSSLSLMNSMKGYAFALFAFPCGFLGEMLPRPVFLACGMISWGLGMAACAMAPSFEILFAARVFCGAGLGIVQPLQFSLIADKAAPSKRGSYLGSVLFAGWVGTIIFNFPAASLASTPILGIVGWRFMTWLVAIFSILIGLAFWMVVEEPYPEKIAENRQNYTCLQVFKNGMSKVWELFKVPTFLLLLCQGGPGTAPWTVLPNFIQYLELSCFTNSQAALIYTFFGVGQGISALISGRLLNFTARRFPDHGPPCIAMFSVASGIPFLTVFFFLLPKPDLLGEAWPLVATWIVCMLMFGMSAAMCGCLNKKVFADVVPVESFTYVFAFDQMIENAIGYGFAAMTGVLSDLVFKYDVSAVEDGECAPAEGAKLGMAMFIICNVGWIICFLVYCGLHCTYPKDRYGQLLTLKEKADKAVVV